MSRNGYWNVVRKTFADEMKQGISDPIMTLLDCKWCPDSAYKKVTKALREVDMRTTGIVMISVRARQWRICFGEAESTAKRAGKDIVGHVPTHVLSTRPLKKLATSRVSSIRRTQIHPGLEPRCLRRTVMFLLLNIAKYHLKKDIVLLS
jgi:hypothetical protein